MKEAIVLAGGLGTRLKEVVADVPKPMAPINGRPFLDILLYNLSKKGIHKVVLSVGYMADVIQDYFGSTKYGLEIIYNTEKVPLGTGGGIYSSLKICTSEAVLILNGDTFIDFDYKLIYELWHKNKKPIILTRIVNDTSRYGKITIANNKIKSFSNEHITKEENKVINAGVYILPKNILDQYSDNDVFSFESDFLPNAVTSRDFYSVQSDDYFIDIGIPEDYERAQTELVNRIYND